MTGNDPSAVVRDVQTLFSVGAVGRLSDGELLERFLARRDPAAEAAFATLVERHGLMVWGVCRRLLDDPHAAADAFQATFLVLARKARRVRVDGTLGRWLYGVARRVAMRARSLAARRAAREAAGVDSLIAPESEPHHAELYAALDEEIGRLPERYRAAMVLCDLGNLSHEAAARQLGCAVGTIGSRLARGRERLRDRLTRRGFAPLAALVAAGLPVERALAAAAVPPALAQATARAAVRIALGETALVSAHVSTLSKGMGGAMFPIRLSLGLLCLSLASAGVLVFAHRAASAPRAAAPAAARAEKGAAPAQPGAGANAEAADQVLARMASTYAEARSYQDDGVVTLVFIDPNGRRRTDKKPFATKFVRPNLFRFEYWSRYGDGPGENNHYVIWSDAAPENARSWWTIRPEVREWPLDRALGAAAGVSSSSSRTIPSLLVPGALGRSSLSALSEPHRTGEEAVDDILCDKIEGKDVRGEPMTVWIDRATSLVRKTFSITKIPNAIVEHTTTYQPRLNPAIPAEQFAFEPPKP
jgi:RNA polymerase sigma factor (sigma-70 family)